MAAKHKPNRKKRPSKANYNSSMRWLENKVKRIVRHLKKFPNDETSQAALRRAQART